ncbi:uncharacterized protein si:ch211-191i18.2 [Pungitius pungitius]|uniref:uncharacterized protein si:ch211-191i18.2 n=1 Tax=Pungitius pungitius TaxID=134920 RepID=UPI002E10A434
MAGCPFFVSVGDLVPLRPTLSPHSFIHSLLIMSSWSLLCVCLSGASLSLLLPAGVQAQYYDVTPPDYGDYNVTFEYSFYSNTSSEDLDQFSERFIDGEEDKGGRREEQDVTVTITTTRGTTERGGVNVLNAASLPVPLEIRTLLWTLVTLISLQHTL